MAICETMPNKEMRDKAKKVLNYYYDQFGRVICRSWPGRDQRKKKKD